MIEGKVAAILNSRELAINRGAEHGVLEGMRFEVLDTSVGKITDPETGEPLGLIEAVKVRVEVTDVNDRFSVAQTYEMMGGSGLLMSQSLSALLKYEPAKVRTLKTQEALFAPLSEQESYVKRGDVVREILEDEARESASEAAASEQT